LDLPSWDDVLIAHERIAPYIHRTPVLTSRFMNELTGAELFFKCENFQKAGAFKVRGATNAVFGLSDEMAERASRPILSGNHALSLSYAAGRRGIPCNVVMPRTAPEAKKAAVRGYGGTITECEPSTTSREEVFAEVHGRTGRGFRASLQRPARDRRAGHLFARVHGTGRRPRRRDRAHRRRRHGLGLLPDAVEHRAERGDLRRRARAGRRRLPLSFKAGHIIADDAPVTIADGLKVPLKERTWHFVSNHVTDILTASEEEIIDAMKLTWQRMKIVMEPSCAVPLATIIKNPDVFRGKRVGVIVTGGNVDLDKLPWMNGMNGGRNATRAKARLPVGWAWPAQDRAFRPGLTEQMGRPP
jgi:threonine dehydratase